MHAGPSTLASASSSSSTLVDPGPLPVKQGEIGFNESTGAAQGNPTNNEPTTVLPERHPADRDHPQSVPTQAHVSVPKPRTVKHAIFGFHSTDLLILCVLFVTIVGTVIAWVVLGTAMSSNKIPSLTGTVAIVVHLVFTVFLIIQLTFFERRFFNMRAKKSICWHSDISDPTQNVCPSTLAPWARPPLPTYNSTLVQSGVRTGDVEDNIIAMHPPPAYGNTRGSTLLLAGFLTETMRRERPISVVSQKSNKSRVSRNERPLSYRSHDEEWEEYCDAQRARALEETLATLERPALAVTRTR